MLLFLTSLPPQLFVPAAIGIFLAVLLGMTVHEFAHNYVAHLMGDPMPQRWGKLTLNPFVHIYLPGFLMFLIIGFGILGTAPIDPYRMPRENRRWRYLASVAAGPFSNFLLALVVALVLRILLLGGSGNVLFAINSNMLFYILFWFIYFNLLQFVFNLLPFFPIDGWHMVFTLLPADLADWWYRQRQLSQYILLFLIFAGFVIPSFSPLAFLIIEPITILLRLVLGL